MARRCYPATLLAGVGFLIASIASVAVAHETGAFDRPLTDRWIIGRVNGSTGTPTAATPGPTDCPVTPYAAEPPNVPATMARTAEGERVSFTRTWFHAEGIWAGLSPAQQGEWYAGPEGQKVLWVRPGRFLDIDGRRLDGPAPPLEATIPDGYSGAIQASGLVFPTEGCWEVTARASNRVLRFVVLVHPAAEHPLRVLATPESTG